MLANGSKTLSQDSTIEKVSVTPVHGAVTIAADGTFQYAHDGSAEATDSFVYEALGTDGATHAVRIDVSVLKILRVSAAGSEVHLQFNALEGALYDVESSTNPSIAESWVSITGRIHAENAVVTIVDSEPPAGAHYRVVCHSGNGNLRTEAVVPGFGTTPTSEAAASATVGNGHTLVAEDGTR